MTTPADTARELLRQYAAMRRAPGTHPRELQQAREAAARWCARAGWDAGELLERIEVQVMVEELDRSAPLMPTDAELDSLEAELERNPPRLSSDAEVDALMPTDAELDSLESELEQHARRLGIG